MNTENTQNSSSNSPAGAVKKHWGRAFIYLLLYLALAGIWSYYCASCIRSNGSSYGKTNGSGAGGGNGLGASASGTGSGAGDSGSGSGKNTPAAQKQSAGSGNKSGETGSQGKSSDTTQSGTPGDTSRSIDAVSSAPQQIESIARHQPSPAVKAGNAGNIAGRKGFYGVETALSTRSIFIVDTSGSMGAMSREMRGSTRVEVLQQELIKSIFDPKRKAIGGFIIFSFNSTTRRFPEKNICRYRNRKTMQEARQFIESLQAGGGTMMQQVWEKALESAKEEKTDTIYFMTDGIPGDNFNDQWLLERLKRHHLTKLKIHCISVGMDQQFMKKIADHTHGKYIYIP